MPDPRLPPALAAWFPTPTPVQRAAAGPLLDGSDAVVIAPTGSGKTAAYLLPLLTRAAGSRADGPGLAVLAPTRELADQIAAVAAAMAAPLSLRVTALVGGAADGPQIAALAAGADVVVATPGRWLDLWRRGHLRVDAVQALVVDEADRLLDDGFAPDVRAIAAALPPHQTVLVSATFPAPAAAAGLVVDAVEVDLSGEQPALDRIEQHVLYVRKEHKHQLLAHLLADLPRALVFVRTRASAERAVERLSQRGRAAAALHGELPLAARRAALAAARDAPAGVLVATDVAARGLHLPGLVHVINVDLPNEPATYLHRVGRTARAGARGVAHSFCDPSEHGLLAAIEALVGRPLQPLVSHPFHDWDLLPPPSSARAKKARRDRRR